MTYIVAIPTYKRYEICKHRTLQTLRDNNIDPRRIMVFVANKEEYIEYKKVLDPSSYNKLIVGVKGLMNQREFICNYLPIGTNIVYMDDDIEYVDLSMTKLPISDLHAFFTFAFKLCKKENIYLWGLYPTYNPFYREGREDITMDLRFIVGAFYGIINRRDKDLKIHIDNKEDVERTLLHYIKDGGVIRFNRIGFKTKYYGNTGGMGNFNSRLLPNKESALWLAKNFSEYGYVKIRKNGMYEFPLRRLPRIFTT